MISCSKKKACIRTLEYRHIHNAFGVTWLGDVHLLKKLRYTWLHHMNNNFLRYIRRLPSCAATRMILTLLVKGEVFKNWSTELFDTVTAFRESSWGATLAEHVKYRNSGYEFIRKASKVEKSKRVECVQEHCIISIILYASYVIMMSSLSRSHLSIYRTWHDLRRTLSERHDIL